LPDVQRQDADANA